TVIDAGAAMGQVATSTAESQSTCLARAAFRESLPQSDLGDSGWAGGTRQPATIPESPIRKARNSDRLLENEEDCPAAMRHGPVWRRRDVSLDRPDRTLLFDETLPPLLQTQRPRSSLKAAHQLSMASSASPTDGVSPGAANTGRGPET